MVRAYDITDDVKLTLVDDHFESAVFQRVLHYNKYTSLNRQHCRHCRINHVALIIFYNY